MDSKKRILTASQQLFSQFGLKKVTTDDIAKKAGVSKATIYKFYKNKEEILNKVVKLESDHLVREIHHAVGNESTVINKLRAYLLTKNQIIHGLVNLYKVTRVSDDSYWPYIHDAQDRYILKEKAIVGKILADGNESGEIDVAQVDLCAHILVIAFRTLEFPWALKGYDILLTDHIEELLNIVMNGLAKK